MSKRARSEYVSELIEPSAQSEVLKFADLPEVLNAIRVLDPPKSTVEFEEYENGDIAFVGIIKAGDKSNKFTQDCFKEEKGFHCCKLCPDDDVHKYKIDGTGTNSRFRHANAKHGYAGIGWVMRELAASEQKPTNVASSGAKTRGYGPSGSIIEAGRDMWAEQCYEVFLKFLLNTNMPFNVVNNPFFRQMIAVFFQTTGIPRGFHIDRKTIRSNLNDKFQVQNSNLISTLESVSAISLQLDVWTRHDGFSVMGVIGNWTNEKFEMEERTLDCILFQDDSDHTGDRLRNVLKTSMERLGLMKKIISITGDNATYNDKMVELFAEDMKEAGNEFFGRYNDGTVRCFAHILNLVMGSLIHIPKGLEGQSDVDRIDPDKPEALDNGETELLMGCDLEKAKVKTVVLKIHKIALDLKNHKDRRSEWKTAGLLAHGMSDQSESRFQNKYIQYSVATRWNSTYRMIEDALQTRPVIAQLENSKNFDVISAEEWNLLEGLRDVMKVINDLSLVASSSKPEFPGLYALHIKLMKHLIRATERKGNFENLNRKVSIAARMALAKAKKYLHIVGESSLLWRAAILNPCDKGRILYSTQANLGVNSDRALEKYKAAIEHIRNQVSLLNASENEASDSDSEFLDSEDERVQKFADSFSEGARPQDELERYLADRYPPHIKSVDYMQWWSDNQNLYPKLSVIARYYLSIPIAEVSVERMFSKGADILGLRKHQLSSETFRMLMLSRAWNQHDEELSGDQEGSQLWDEYFDDI